LGGTFVDSGIFVAFSNTRDRDHTRAAELLDQARKGEFGLPHTSDYVFDEVVTTTLVRTRRPDLAVRAGEVILGSKEDYVSPFIRLVEVDEDTFSKSWVTFKSRKFESLSFTDHTILVQTKELGLDSVVSFDSGFDGIVKRIS
jgi:predicted nucleic acid-binding protein